MPCEKNSRKICSNEKCKICFDKSFASHPKSSYWSEENTISAREVFKSTGTKYKFNCDCGHTFETSPHSVSSGNWCPYESNHKLCNNNDCNQCYQKSFASHPKSSYWSEENTILAREVFKNTGTKYKFNCDCKHGFFQSPHQITSGHWCPYESNKKLCDDNDCVQCHDKSFASHPKSTYWSEENIISARAVFLNSTTKYKFNCDCGHGFFKTPHGVNWGKWCPYESNHKLCDDDDCDQCYQKSFASHPRVKFWLDEIDPRTVFKSSSTKYPFMCEKKHIFYMPLDGLLHDRWCPHCFRKTERKFYEYLTEKRIRF